MAGSIWSEDVPRGGRRKNAAMAMMATHGAMSGRGRRKGGGNSGKGY